MAKNDVERVTEEHISNGGVLVKFYFDMQHKERDKLQPILVDLINERLMKEKGVVYCYGSIEEPLEQQGTWITSAMVTVLFDSFVPLIGVAFKYAPAGIEVLKPLNQIVLKTHEMQSLLMDLSQISMDYSKYILERVLKPEDIDAIHSQINNRAELGKKLLEKKGEDKE